jgi:hypothetical protein
LSGTADVSGGFGGGLKALLADSPAELQRLERSAEQIYEARSMAVHGVRERPLTELEELRIDAFGMILRALCRLYGDPPELIADKRRGRTLTRRMKT